MLQNIYSLPDLIDLALTVPEAGAVNFNILHTVLHAIVKELNFTDVRPWCHIENPLLVRAALTKAKLQGEEQRRTISDSSFFQKTDIFKEHILPKAISADNVPSKVSDFSQPDKKISEEPATEVLSEPDTSKRDSAAQTEVMETESEKFYPSTFEEISTSKDRDVTDESKKVIFTPPTTPSPIEAEAKPETKTMEASPKSPKEGAAESAWILTNVYTRLDATEEGLHRLSNIVDIIVDKMRKAEERKKAGGFQSEELESFDERILEIEDAFYQIKSDHTLLLNMNEIQTKLLEEFGKFKDLAAGLEKMQSDIDKKADQEETAAALAQKGDLELVNTKVDSLEFETAVEELGEAIGVLGLKFTRKIEEWDKRAEEIWAGINSKMTLDVFEEAKIKIESRITALMHGLKKLKKVVEDLLYPEASGVTKCIVCRRPACISGSECIGIFDSPKRPLSEKSSEDDGDSKRIRKMMDDAFVKRKKLDVPPYCESRDVILKIPYSSSSYRSSAKEREFTESSQMKLMPVISDRDSAKAGKPSQVPKLPDIKGYGSPKLSKRKTSISKRSKAKPRTQKESLVFTKKLLADYAGKYEETTDEKWQSLVTAVLEEEPPKREASLHSFESSRSSVVITPDPEKAMEFFAPAKVMPDALRRDIFVSRVSSKEQKMTLSPLKSEVKSRTISTKSSEPEEDEMSAIPDSPEISESAKEDEVTASTDSPEISETEKDEEIAISDSSEISDVEKEDEMAAYTDKPEISESGKDEMAAITDKPKISEPEKEDEVIPVTGSPEISEQGKEDEMTPVTDSPEISEPEMETSEDI